VLAHAVSDCHAHTMSDPSKTKPHTVPSLRRPSPTHLAVATVAALLLGNLKMSDVFSAYAYLSHGVVR
jgi:hypothetical protein